MRKSILMPSLTQKDISMNPLLEYPYATKFQLKKTVRWNQHKGASVKQLVAKWAHKGCRYHFKRSVSALISESCDLWDPVLRSHRQEITCHHTWKVLATCLVHWQKTSLTNGVLDRQGVIIKFWITSLRQRNLAYASLSYLHQNFLKTICQL
jgi:hypothetical protein